MEIYLNSETILSLPAYTSAAIVTKFPKIERKLPAAFDPGGSVPSAKMTKRADLGLKTLFCTNSCTFLEIAKKW